jgi:hypothetical protein
MGGKFRVKAEGGGQSDAPPVLRRNRRRINQLPRFHDPEKPCSPRKTFSLGRSVVITDNAPS